MSKKMKNEGKDLQIVETIVCRIDYTLLSDSLL